VSILAECPGCRQKQSNKNKFCPKCGTDLDRSKRSNRVRYWIDYRLPGGKQRRELVGNSIAEARNAMGKRRSQKREGRFFDMVPESRITFDDLTKWYLSLEKVKSLAAFDRIKYNLQSFNGYFGNRIVGNIKPINLENYQMSQKKKGLSDAYIDQQVQVAKTMCNRAFHNDMIAGDVIKVFGRVKRLLKKGSDVRDVILSPDQFDRLMDELPIHLKPIVATAYFTGMRRGEILNLTWESVDLVNKTITLEAEVTKDREKRIIPICDELYQYLKDIPRAIHTNHVFLYRGAPFKDIRTGLRKACVEAGVPYGRNVKGGFIFHDLRRSFNTHMRRAGVPEGVIMRITGHSSRTMFDRYDTVDHGDMKNAVDRLQKFLNVDQNVDQGVKKALTKNDQNNVRA